MFHVKHCADSFATNANSNKANAFHKNTHEKRRNPNLITMFHVKHCKILAFWSKINKVSLFVLDIGNPR